MSNRLDQIAIIRDEAKAEIVRAALRLYLDQQEDLISSRKHFTKMFQRRMTHLERMTTIMFWLNVQMMQILMEQQRQQSYDLMDLLSDVIVSGLDTEDGIYTLIETAVHQKTKPPTT